MSVKFDDLFGRINLHGKYSVSDFEESHNFVAGPFDYVSEFGCREPFSFYLFLEINDLDSLCGNDNEGQPRWNVELCAVSPECVPQKEKDAAIKSCGWDGMALDDNFQMAQCLDSYGTHANIESYEGSNLRLLIKDAIKEARNAVKNISSYMHKSQNRIGTTFEEALHGDLMAPLRRQPTNEEAMLVQRMHGISTLADLADGKVVSVKQSMFQSCPHCIMALEHYDTLGHCRCKDPNHKEMIDWGYVWSGTSWEAGEEED